MLKRTTVLRRLVLASKTPPVQRCYTNYVPSMPRICTSQQSFKISRPITRNYSDRSHYRGVVLNQYFLHNAFLNSLYEMEVMALGELNSTESSSVIFGKLGIAFKVFAACLRAHSKLEEAGMLLAIHQKSTTQEQKDFLNSVKSEHVKQSQQLRHIESSFNRVRTSTNFDEVAADLHKEIGILSGMLNDHFEKYATLLRNTTYADLFSEKDLQELYMTAMLQFDIDKEDLQEEHKEDIDVTTLNNILFMFNTFELTVQLVREILVLMSKIGSGTNSDRVKSTLKDIKKACPLFVWQELELKLPPLAEIDGLEY